MIKIVTIIGARPQIIKAAAISRVVRESFIDIITEITVHTGQHYDNNMSEVFFTEMGIPAPHYNLNAGSSTHAVQTAMMLEKTEKVLIKEKPDVVILYGDTNSTLAGSVAAAKLFIPVVHVEAGLRSFNKTMPEEINRIVCDHASTLLFTPTLAGVKNLEKEGFNPKNKSPFNINNPGVFHCGDVMYDNAVYYSETAEKKSGILKELNIEKGKYLLATIHREYNTDNPARLNSIFSAIDKISTLNNIISVLPLHPRTSKIMEKFLLPELYESITANRNIKITGPVSFFDMIALEKHSKMIITDSGGVQKEAYFYCKPCIIIRPETEWTEIVESGAGIIADASEEKIIGGFEHFYPKEIKSLPPVFGDGKAAEFICNTIVKNFSQTI